MRKCVHCNIAFDKRSQRKFCSLDCQFRSQQERWVESWKEGRVSGGIGITARNISQHLRKYLIEKFENRCSECGWNKRHPLTGVVPLEIDHIDGDSENNLEYNLRLLCPNCHALAPFYKNLNKGNGRMWRVNKYIRNKPIAKYRGLLRKMV